MKNPPPTPILCGSASPIHNKAPMAASTALPPDFCMISLCEQIHKVGYKQFISNMDT